MAEIDAMNLLSISNDTNSVYLEGNITDQSVDGTIKQLSAIRENGDNQFIVLYVDSNGGSLTAGFRLVDYIRESSIPIYTVSKECAYGMGAYILACGSKKYMKKNASMIITGITVNATCDNHYDEMNGFRKFETMLEECFLKNTGIDQKTFRSLTTNETMLSCDNCLSMGVIDGIVQ